MKARIVTGLLAVAVAATDLVAGAGVARAQQAEYTVSESTYRSLEKAQRALEKKQYQEALSACGRVLARRSINDYEKALALQTRAYVHVDRSKLALAARDLRAAAALEALPDERQTELFFNIGQILLSMEKPREAVASFETWHARASKPSPDALYTVAVAYAQSNRYAEALPFLNRAIRGKGRKAPTNWREVQLACLVQLKRWDPAIRVLTDLVEEDFENPKRWKQLSALYAEAGRSGESVAVLEAMYWNDLLVEQDDIVLLARNLLAANVPTKAARILEQSMKRGRVKKTAETLELLGTAYVTSSDREAAIGPLLAAARRSKQGRLFKEVGQLYLELEDYAEAAKNLRRALAAGGLRQPGQTYVLLGVAEYRGRRIGAARAAFKKAATFDDGRRAARSWLGFLAAEP